MPFNDAVDIDAFFLKIRTRNMHFFKSGHNLVNVLHFEQRIFQNQRKLFDLLVQPVTEYRIVIIAVLR